MSRMTKTADLRGQLELHGLDGTRRQLIAGAGTAAERSRITRLVETAHDLLAEPPSPDDLAFLYSGLCQTALPHKALAHSHDVWERRAGRFSLTVVPGVIGGQYVGVPYGSRARLIMIFLQSEGMRSPTVALGKNLSSFLRSLGLHVSGGPRGNIKAVREQARRIAQCRFTMEWTETASDGQHTYVRNTAIADGLALWAAGAGEWSDTVELSAQFHALLREHAVPLDKRAVARLAGNSLGLDLYALLAYRLPRLRRDLHLSWGALQQQIGTDYAQGRDLGRRVRAVLPDVLFGYPHAKIELTSTGLLLKSSRPVIPRDLVAGFRLVEGG